MVFSNGDKYCNRCQYRETSGGLVELPTHQGTSNDITSILKLPILEIPDRGISKETCEHFGVRVAFSEETGEMTHHYYPIQSRGELIGFKERTLPKRFLKIGDSADRTDLFGQSLCGDGGKMIVLTEGELDAMAAHQMFRDKGKHYRVVSVPFGANSRAIEENLEWLSSFENVVVCPDQDEAGLKLADSVSDLLPPGKVKVMRFNEKDPSEMLLKGKQKEFYAALLNSNVKRPDGIVSGKDTWEILKNQPRAESIPYPEDWEEMNRMTYGMRLGELDTWTSGSGSGKTQIFRELQYHLLMSTKENLGVVALEEPLPDTVEAIMSLHLNKRIHLPDIRETVSEEEQYNAWLATVGTNRIHFYDHFGSVDDDSLISKIRYLAKGLGCKYIFLDHLSIVVSEFASDGGERERIDTVMTRLKKLTQELNIWIGLIVHLRKTTVGGKSFEEGAVPTLDDLRGSGAIKQLSNGVFATSRDQQHDDIERRNTNHLTILKCRFTGSTGPADELHFDNETGRLSTIGLQIKEAF